MSDDLVTRTKAMLEGVTDGPWEVVWERPEGEYVCEPPYAYAIYGPADHATLDSAGCSDDYKAQYGHQITEIVGLSDADAEFMAGARQLVPELLAEVVKVRADVERLRHERRDESRYLVETHNERAALRRAIETIRSTADRWANQPTDYDEDTEQQIEDGRELLAVIERIEKP